MEIQIVVENTDYICINNENSQSKVDNIQKEAFKKYLVSKKCIISKKVIKKVGLPALVIKTKNVQNSFKKAGLHPSGKNNNSCKRKPDIALANRAATTTTTYTWCPSTTHPGTPSTSPWFSLSWTYSGITVNKLMKAINGNKQKGYNLGFWNCRRGLTDNTGEQASYKITEVKAFLEKKKLHMLCLAEADLHSVTSRIRRRRPLTTTEIINQLDIPGYKIYLPMSWYKHGQARVLVYAKEELKVKERILGVQLSDLPMLIFEIAFGMEKKTIVNFFYREFASGVSGLSDSDSQSERLLRITKHWRSLAAIKKDTVFLGDVNLCAKKWNEDNYNLKGHA